MGVCASLRVARPLGEGASGGRACVHTSPVWMPVSSAGAKRLSLAFDGGGLRVCAAEGKSKLGAGV